MYSIKFASENQSEYGTDVCACVWVCVCVCVMFFYFSFFMVMHHMAPPRMCVNRTKSLISAQLPAEMAQSETIPTI